MDHVEFVYTVGMTEEEAENYLREEVAGVLSLADDDADAYGVPISHHYDAEEGRLLVRLSDDGDSEKLRFLESTNEASFALYGVDDDEGHSWSVMVRGPVRLLSDDDYDDARINDLFDPVRVFDEDVEAVDVHVAELSIRTMTGRRTAADQ
jgi:hypothetical protein